MHCGQQCSPSMRNRQPAAGIADVLWVRTQIGNRRRIAAKLAGGVAAAIRSSVSGLRPATRSARHIAILVAAFCAAAAPAAYAQMVEPGVAVPAEPDAYRLGVFPYVPVLTIDRIYGPVAAQLSEDLGRPVVLKTKSTFERFTEEMRNETYDVILVHPFFYIEARDKHHYLPLARLDEPLTAMFMVPEDDPTRTLAELKGRTIGLPPALSAVSELVRTALIKAGLTPGIDVALEHYRSKPSCLQAVAIGLVDVCALPKFALDQIDPTNEFDLRMMFETPPVNSFVFAAHARVPQEDRINLSKSILAWPYTAKGRAILAGGGWTRFVPARDSDYDDVRRYAMQLRKFALR
jgi:ABC-type phosphate/phosphonate transport system substrate-binding protein